MPDPFPLELSKPIQVIFERLCRQKVLRAQQNDIAVAFTRPEEFPRDPRFFDNAAGNWAAILSRYVPRLHFRCVADRVHVADLPRAPEDYWTVDEPHPQAVFAET